MHKSNRTLPYTVLEGEIDLHNQTSVVQLQKYNTLLLVFFVSPQIVQNVVALAHFFQHVPHVNYTFKYTYQIPMHMSFIGLYKGQVSLASR